MIDNVVILSLPHREDRRSQLLKSYPRCLPQPKFFNGFTPKTLLTPASWPHRESYYSTTQGHIQLLNQLWVEDEWTCTLVLEDDALFKPESEQIQEWLKHLDLKRPDWLGVFFGPYYQQAPTVVDSKINLNNGSTMSHAYCFRRHGLWRLVDHLYCDFMRIVDWAYNEMMKSDKAFFSPSETFITTSEGFSDNELGWKHEGT